MSQSKAMILGCAGLSPTQEELALYRDERPWGFILFARNLSEPEQIRDLVASLKDSIGRPDAPVLIDQEGGRVQRIRAPHVEAYPPAARLGEVYEADRGAGLRAAWLMSRLHAFDLLKFGIDVDCLPVLDVPVEGASDVIGSRAYGKNPAIVTEMGRSAAAGLKAGGVQPVMKHMPGHGRGMADSHHELPVVDADADALETDLAPFIKLSDAPMAMTAHVVYPAWDREHCASLSPTIIADIIRGRIGFDGLLMSDDLGMHALTGDFGGRAAAVLKAGCDIALHCSGDMAEMQAIAKAVGPIEAPAQSRLARAMATIEGRTGADDVTQLIAKRDALMAVLPV